MKMRLILGLVPAAATIAAFAACTGQSLDLGNDAAATTPDASSPGSPQGDGATATDAISSPSQPDAGTGADDNADVDAGAPLNVDAAGGSTPYTIPTDGGVPVVFASPASDQEVWTGYVENYTFTSGSDDVKVALTEVGDGTITGHIYFGDLPIFSPPTDPNVGYPVASIDSGTYVDTTNLDEDLYEGFAITLRYGTLSSGRLKATFAQEEVEASWCSLQTSFLQQDLHSYSCNTGGFGELKPATAGDGGPPALWFCDTSLLNGGFQAVNCSKGELCALSDICACVSTGCGSAVSATDPGRNSLDVNVNGDRADGSLLLESGTLMNIHLTRQ